MKQVSNKRREQLAQYKLERKDYLREHPLCQICKKRRSWDVHHINRREGKLLLDKTQWLSVCRTCHERVHSEPRWAKENGYLH